MSDIIGPRRRGPYPRAFKAGIIEQCRQGGVSVEDVATHHGLRASLVYRWLAQDTVETGPVRPDGAAAPAAFVSFEPVAADPGASIRIEVQHGPAAVTIHWPVQAASSCGVWLAHWLSS